MLVRISALLAVAAMLALQGGQAQAACIPTYHNDCGRGSSYGSADRGRSDYDRGYRAGRQGLPDDYDYPRTRSPVMVNPPRYTYPKKPTLGDPRNYRRSPPSCRGLLCD